MKTRSDDLALLLSVVDTGSFSAAAEASEVQVARVSRSVARLEQQLDTTLLNRTTRRVELTEEGRRFVEGVREGLAQLQRAEEGLDPDRTPAGRLRVDAAAPFALHQLVPLTAEFHRRFPEIQLELTAHDGYIDLLEHRTDVAIRIGRLQDSKLHARRLGTSPLHIVASPEYLAEHGTPQTPAELSQHALLGFADAPRLNQWPLTGMSEFRPTFAASNGEVIRQLALAGNGIACLSSFMVKRDLAAGTLVPVLTTFQQPDPDREQIHAVYYRSSQLSRRIQVFLDYLSEALDL
ncbi:LysR family transcriptional regulator [Ferrimonas marina]|uniref:Transcriptional regulator, LysR family n=1 Tax=Ferrimonas marina TaxID=299255 RepID=A0A1M5YRW0_9GAMM|nr:LysR family transcriptional regulator [Ferrimonas marina]SHI14711.1 transcriptional regulator, LysR family [Ferrimonas marina]